MKRSRKLIFDARSASNNRLIEKDKAKISATPRLLTIKKASIYSGLPVWAIRQLIWSEKIAYIRLGAKYYLDITDIEDWIRLNKIQKDIQKENP